MSAHWRRNEGLDVRFIEVGTGKQSTDTGQVTLSAEHRLWRELSGRAGFQARYQMLDNARTELGINGTLYTNHQRTQQLDEAFDWGVGYTWRNFEVRTAVRQTLDLLDLFLALDLIVQF